MKYKKILSTFFFLLAATGATTSHASRLSECDAMVSRVVADPRCTRTPSRGYFKEPPPKQKQRSTPSPGDERACEIAAHEVYKTCLTTNLHTYKNKSDADVYALCARVELEEFNKCLGR